MANEQSNADQKALDIINDWESGTYACKAQKKAVLQCEISDLIVGYERRIKLLEKKIEQATHWLTK